MKHVLPFTFLFPLAAFAAIVGYFLKLKPKRYLPPVAVPQPEPPHWEAIKDEWPSTMWRVRWSEKDASGKWLYVRHYGGHSGNWDRHVAEADAERLNKDGEKPWSMSPQWRSVPQP